MNDREIQNLSRNGTSSLRNTADTMFACRIVTARCQAKIVRKTAGSLETLNVADPGKERDGSHDTDTGYPIEPEHVLVRFAAIEDFFSYGENLFVVQIPRFEMRIDFKSVNDRQWNRCDPLPKLLGIVKFGRCVLGHVVFVDDPFDLVDDFRALGD